MKIKYGQRKAISPIIATVLIIAVTLIAAVAIGGFVFGLFGSSSSTAQVTATSASITAGTVTSAAAASVVYVCTSPATSQQLIFSNLGTVSTSVLSLSITFGGKTYSGSAPAACTVTAGSTTGISFTTLAVVTGTTLPSSGSQYSGFIVTSNGAQVVFTGAFA